MIELTIFNLILLLIIAGLLILVKKTVKTEKTQNIILVIVAVVTILFHYSTLIYYIFSGQDAYGYVKSNPNLILPIYPCNVVMWSCLIINFIKNKESKLYKFFIDYIFWFGIFSTLVGMFANVDFIMNPTLKNYDNVKSIVAHATLLFNILLLPIYGKISLNMNRNMINMILSVIMMYVIGLYCNLVFKVLISEEAAYNVNSMFIIHSPFAGVEFLKYPLIAGIALILYFIIFFVCDVIKNPKGERWYNKVYSTIKEKLNKSNENEAS